MRKKTPLNDFYINDLQESNILIDFDQKDISLVDLDSCKIGDNIAFPSRYMLPSLLIGETNAAKYIKNNPSFIGEGYYIANSESDIYCYIMIIMNYLFGCDLSGMTESQFYMYLNYLESVGIDKNLLDCFAKILKLEQNINPYHYLDSLTYEQLGRARKNVYKLHLKKENM